MAGVLREREAAVAAIMDKFRRAKSVYLAFVIDCTLSMEPYIAEVQSKIIATVDDIQACAGTSMLAAVQVLSRVTWCQGIPVSGTSTGHHHLAPKCDAC